MKDCSPQSILVLHHGGTQIRGSERVLLDLLRNIPPESFHPVVAMQGEALLGSLAERGIAVERVDFAELVISNTESRFPFGRYLRTFARLRRMARQRQVTLVLANGGAPCQMGVPLAASLGVPLVCIMHHPAPRKFQFFWLTRLVRTMVYVSEHTAQHTRRLIGAGGAVVHPGVDVARMRPAELRDPSLRRGAGIPDDAIVFGQVGALVAYKGHSTLIEAFADLSSDVSRARLVLIGDGAEADQLRTFATTLGVGDRVVFTGFVPDVLPWLQHVIDVNVLPSSEEGLGLVTLEAGACGVPTIGADATGIRETIIHERTGLLVTPGSRAALAECMRALALDSSKRCAMGAAARQHVEQSFPDTSFAERVSRIMRDAIDEKRTGIAFRRSGRWSWPRPSAPSGAMTAAATNASLGQR